MTIKRILFFLILFSAGASIASGQQAGRSGIASDYIKQGNACYDKKDYSKAISLYTKAAKEDPKNIMAALAHFKCAKSYEAMGKHDNAISECSKSIAIDPLVNKDLTYLLRAYLYEKTGKYVEAVSDYSKALIINPDDKEAWVCRQRLLIGIYTKFLKEGLAAFNRGLADYNSRKNAPARKELDKALSLFTYAMSFDIGDKTAFAMANFTKGLEYQMMARGVVDAIKPASSNTDAAPKLVSAYYTLAVANAYYEKAFPSLKNEKLKNSLKELKSVNDKDIAMARPRITGLDAASENYTKVVDLEAASIVNFDAANQSIAAGDHDGAKRILKENYDMAADLRRLKSANAEGIGYMCDAYVGINTIFSYPLTDASWLKANKTTLDGKINDCLNDLGRAKAALINKELANNCSVLLKKVSVLKKIFGKIGAKP